MIAFWSRLKCRLGFHDARVYGVLVEARTATVYGGHCRRCGCHTVDIV